MLKSQSVEFENSGAFVLAADVIWKHNDCDYFNCIRFNDLLLIIYSIS